MGGVTPKHAGTACVCVCVCMCMKVLLLVSEMNSLIQSKCRIHGINNASLVPNFMKTRHSFVTGVEHRRPSHKAPFFLFL